MVHNVLDCRKKTGEKLMHFHKKVINYYFFVEMQIVKLGCNQNCYHQKLFLTLKMHRKSFGGPARKVTALPDPLAGLRTGPREGERKGEG